jgi:D-alanyl-D-alanine carboxypeptidase
VQPIIDRHTCRFSCVALVALALAGSIAPASAGPYVVMDAVSGRVIAHSEAGQPWYPASVTKLMTTFVTFRAMREGRVKPDTLLTVSERALAQAPTKMGFAVGTQVTIDNALKMLMVKSANDIAVALAEGVGGSYDAFIAEMNKTARELGMTATHYNNPNGLPDDGQVTSVRDMAILARAIYREFPEQEMMFRIPALKLGKRIIRNHNKLIDHYPGADGMKTGFVCASGFNIVATAKRGNKRLIVVVFGGRSGASRNEDAARLFEKGFSPIAPIAAVFRNEPRTIESIPNLATLPVDMHEQMCGKGRKRHPTESDIDDDSQEAETPDSNPNASGQKGLKIKQSLLIDLPPSMEPIRVFVGSASQTEAQKMVSGDDAPVKGRKGKKGRKSSDIAPVQAASPQGGPLVPAPVQSASLQQNVPPQVIQPTQAPQPIDTPKFAPPAPIETANAYEGMPLESGRRTVTAANAPAAIPQAAPAPSAPQSVPARPNLGGLPSSVQAFAAPNTTAFGPGTGSFAPVMSVEPPLELPASVPMPRPRPKL